MAVKLKVSSRLLLELGLLLPKHYVPYGIEEDVLAGGLNRLDSS